MKHRIQLSISVIVIGIFFGTYRESICWSWYKSSFTVKLLELVAGLLLASIVGYALAMYNF